MLQQNAFRFNGLRALQHCNTVNPHITRGAKNYMVVFKTQCCSVAVLQTSVSGCFVVVCLQHCGAASLPAPFEGGFPRPRTAILPTTNHDLNPPSCDSGQRSRLAPSFPP